MRKLFIIALTLGLAFGLATNAFAVVKRGGHRGSPQRETSIREETQPRIGFYLQPVLKVGEIASDVKTMVGIRGGLEFNRSFYVGLAGYGLPGRTHYDYPVDGYYDNYYHHNDWDWGYGGLEFGVITGRPGSGQLSFGVLLGGGGINEYPYYDYNYRDRSFFVMEPQLDFMADINRYVRLSLGASYRYVGDVHSARYTSDDLRGASINFAIGFGAF